MKKSLLLALVAVSVAALAGCSADDSDDTGSSSNDITTGDVRDNGTGADYGQQPVNNTPAPELEGPGAEGAITSKQLGAKLPAGLNLKPVFEVPKPPVESPEVEQLDVR